MKVNCIFSIDELWLTVVLWSCADYTGQW